MPWNEVKRVNQREKFIAAVLEGTTTFSFICQQFGISRPTGYKWLERFKEHGLPGLEDLSRAPHTQAQATPYDLIDIIVSYRCACPKMSPGLMEAILKRDYPFTSWPSATTIAKILREAGLLNKRQYRRKAPWTPSLPPNPIDCNDTWCADFKGLFHTGDGKRCEPFTLTDSHSRFLLRCDCLPRNNEENVWRSLESAFMEYGLPNNFKTDNGSPFASIGVRRLSKLSVKLIKAGVNPVFIAPGKPQQNGRHERMHLTLKQDTAMPPCGTLEEQIVSFESFKTFYNYERPHQSLGKMTPSCIYRPSTRQWNGTLKSPEYTAECVVRKVIQGGTIKLQGKVIFISEALEGEPIGIRAEGEIDYVYFGSLQLGHLDKSGKLCKEKARE